MEKITIDLKYIKPLVGKYNSGVFKCRECDEKLLRDERHGSVYNHITGFADSYMGNVAMVECPNCGEKWYFHSRITDVDGGSYYYFLASIDNSF